MSLSANYFELFDLPITFDIDQTLLTQHYRELQRTLHPDNYANASERERCLAVQTSAHINEAFQTLKNPLTRSRYLLHLHAIELNDERDTAMDSAFLMEQMELHEELATIQQQTHPSNALNHFMSRLEEDMQRLTDTLSQQFKQQEFQTARDTVRRFQFLKRLYEEATTLEEKLI